MLFNGRASMRYHKITSGDRVERLSARASRSEDEELKQVSRHNAKDTTPDNERDPIENILLDREPVECISHVIPDVAKLGDATNHPSSRPKNTIERLQPFYFQNSAIKYHFTPKTKENDYLCPDDCLTGCAIFHHPAPHGASDKPSRHQSRWWVEVLQLSEAGDEGRRS